LALVFNIIKLSTALEDLILDQQPEGCPLPILVDKEEEWEVKEILDSC